MSILTQGPARTSYRAQQLSDRGWARMEPGLAALRYAHLASDSIRDAYDTAIAKTHPRTRLVAGSTGALVPIGSSGSATTGSTSRRVEPVTPGPGDPEPTRLTVAAEMAASVQAAAERQMVVVTPTYAPDLELFSDLHESVLRWFPADVRHVAAQGFCSRYPAAGACPYANICEQCDNFVPDPDCRDVIAAQLADVIEPRDNSAQRGWDEEATRHQHVADSLATHIRHIDRTRPSDASA